MARCSPPSPPQSSTILAKAICIASTSLQHRQSISLRSSRPELLCKKNVLENFAKFTGVSFGTGVSCEFCEILKNTFFHRTPLVAVLRLEISYYNTACNRSAAEARLWLVSFYDGEWWSERLVTCIFLRIITFLIKI